MCSSGVALPRLCSASEARKAMCPRIQGAHTAEEENAAFAASNFLVGRRFGCAVCAQPSSGCRHVIHRTLTCSRKSKPCFAMGFRIKTGGAGTAIYAFSDFRIPSTRFNIVAKRALPLLLLVM